MSYEIPGALRPTVGRLLDPATHDELLRSSVRLARLAFRSGAASVFLYDRRRDELVFEASSGAGEDRLLGVSVPCDQGIVGWVWNTGETIIAHDLRRDPRFNREFAESTGFVPNEIMAGPLDLDGESIGVLEVLDPRLDGYGDAAAIELLTEITRQSSAALSLLVAARSLGPGLRAQQESDPLRRLDAALGRRDGKGREAADALVTALAELLGERG
ncbi:GAF domain-containing protein [Nonomuraea sp. NPDC003707]